MTATTIPHALLLALTLTKDAIETTYNGDTTVSASPISLPINHTMCMTAQAMQQLYLAQAHATTAAADYRSQSSAKQRRY